MRFSGMLSMSVMSSAVRQQLQGDALARRRSRDDDFHAHSSVRGGLASWLRSFVVVRPVDREIQLIVLLHSKLGSAVRMARREDDPASCEFLDDAAKRRPYRWEGHVDEADRAG